MAEYIEREALKKRMFSYYDCVNENTSKSDYRGETLMNYEVADMIEDCIDNAPTADVVPKSEVEKAKQDVVREIFEEIKRTLDNYRTACCPIGEFEPYSYYKGGLGKAIAELEKKYIGE